jgi:hypothetical protein
VIKYATISRLITAYPIQTNFVVLSELTAVTFVSLDASESFDVRFVEGVTTARGDEIR